MLSRLLARNPVVTFSHQPIVKKLTSTKVTLGIGLQRSLLLNSVIHKRWSGHNAMRIEPSNWQWKKYKDLMHFYLLLCGIPILVITTIINVRANPELTEIPEGYEPRAWEYHKHPIARFIAKYILFPPEHEHEVKMGILEMQSEDLLIALLQNKVEKVMKFYNDHRTRFFRPFHGDLIRIDREQAIYSMQHTRSSENLFLEDAYNSDINPVPTAGFKPGEMP